MAEHPFVPFAHSAEVVLKYVADTTPFSNTFGYTIEGTWTETTLHDLIEPVEDAFTELLQGLFAGNVSLIGAKAYSLASTEAPVAEIVINPPVGGNRSGTALTLNVAASVKRFAAGRGRGVRGRIFHYGLVTADKVGSSFWTASAATELAEKYENFADTLALAVPTAVPALLSRQEGNVWLAEGVSRPIIGWQGSTLVVTKRKRLAP